MKKLVVVLIILSIFFACNNLGKNNNEKNNTVQDTSKKEKTENNSDINTVYKINVEKTKYLLAIGRPNKIIIGNEDQKYLNTNIFDTSKHEIDYKIILKQVKDINLIKALVKYEEKYIALASGVFPKKDDKMLYDSINTYYYFNNHSFGNNFIFTVFSNTYYSPAWVQYIYMIICNKSGEIKSINKVSDYGGDGGAAGTLYTEFVNDSIINITNNSFHLDNPENPKYAFYNTDIKQYKISDYKFKFEKQLLKKQTKKKV